MNQKKETNAYEDILSKNILILNRGIYKLYNYNKENF